jgi:arsenite methyltransferase
VDETLSAERRQEIATAVAAKYRAVAAHPEGQLSYPVGRQSALHLGYDPALAARVDDSVASRFVGIGNPYRLGRPGIGERVLDVGCGAGFDAFMASLMVGPQGRAVGVDVTEAMVALGRAALDAWPLANLELLVAAAEELPLADAAFDLVITNGAMNLVADKARAWREIRRVLRPGGRLALADVLLDEAVPDAFPAESRAWST